MTSRIAPSDGYDFGNKRQYRRNIWNAFASFCGTHAATAHAFLMPSSEGDEIDVALNAGFRESNLHLCDDNPAIVAHLKRRYPSAHGYGRRFDVAGSVITPQLIACANLDLTGTIDGAATDVRAFIRTGCMRHHAMIAVTALRGRERGSHMQRACRYQRKPVIQVDRQSGRVTCEGLTSVDVARTLEAAAAVSFNTGYVARFRRLGKYRSTAGHQTMIWWIFELLARGWYTEKLCLLRDAMRSGVGIRERFTDAYPIIAAAKLDATKLIEMRREDIAIPDGHLLNFSVRGISKAEAS